jgi:hypothetical protein
MSWDGSPPPEADVDWGVASHLLVEFDSAGDELQSEGKTYVKIFVKVIFRDPRCAKAMDKKWREGCTVESDLVTCTHFYAQDVDTLRLDPACEGKHLRQEGAGHTVKVK